MPDRLLPPPPHVLIRPLAVAAVVACGLPCGPARAQASAAGVAAPEGLLLQSSPALRPAPAGDAAQQRPIFLRADRLSVRPDLDAQAEGAVEFRRAGTVIEAGRLSYDNATDVLNASGRVRITTPQARYGGQALTLQVQRFTGTFLAPEYDFTALGAGGRAERIDFLDRSRTEISHAVYSSCTRDGAGTPDWLLRADRVRIDLDANEGIAEGAVLQFLGTPILGLPVLSFPLSDERKSGWLPPTIVPVNSRNGTTVAMPYYWNIAPNRDATITPIVYSRLGIAADGEFRYLGTRDSGRLNLSLVPYDQVAGRQRNSWRFEHQGSFGDGTRYGALALRASDDAYWKDFSGNLPTITPRLLSQTLAIERPLAWGWASGEAYARVQRWQVLQTGSGSDLVTAPYQRDPQFGIQLAPMLPGGLRGTLLAEANRFTRPGDSASATLPTGWRAHAVGQLSRPFGDSGVWLEPRLSVNAAAYRLDAMVPGPRDLSRSVPTLSVEAGMAFERGSTWFGRPQRQTLEPRLLYVRTPYRDQSALPVFDTAERDFNTVSIYADNAYSGADRIADANLLTAGAVTRWVDAATGAETLRLGLAQRYRFTPQRVVLDGTPLDTRVSDVLLDGSTALFQPWRFDAAVQYNPDSARVVRSLVAARWSPGPYRTLSLGYRFARALTEQVEVGWQWPVYRGTAQPVGAAGGCGGTLYAVGRVNYSLLDSRATDSLAGVEYDAGCWIGRAVVKRTSTGRSEATTQLLLQIEFVGLSRVGASPLQALKDNIPGYRLLREPGNSLFPTSEP